MSESEMYGPFGYLIIDPALHEDAWRLAPDPESSPEVYSVALFSREKPPGSGHLPSLRADRKWEVPLSVVIKAAEKRGFREAIEAAAKVAEDVYQHTSGMGAQRACLRIIDAIRALSPSKQALSGEEVMDAETLVDRQSRSLLSIASGKCGCWRCIKERDEMRVRMILCPTCGNKRCPKASDHSLTCTDSNDPGQEGSVY